MSVDHIFSTIFQVRRHSQMGKWGLEPYREFWNQHSVGVRRDEDSNQKAVLGLVQDSHLGRMEKLVIQAW